MAWRPSGRPHARQQRLAAPRLRRHAELGRGYVPGSPVLGFRLRRLVVLSLVGETVRSSAFAQEATDAVYHLFGPLFARSRPKRLSVHAVGSPPHISSDPLPNRLRCLVLTLVSDGKRERPRRETAPPRR